jgi:hypothetical protein
MSFHLWNLTNEKDPAHGIIFSCAFRASGMFGTCMHSVLYNVPFTLQLASIAIVNHFAVLLFFLALLAFLVAFASAFAFSKLKVSLQSRNAVFSDLRKWFRGGHWQMVGKNFSDEGCIVQSVQIQNKMSIVLMRNKLDSASGVGKRKVNILQCGSHAGH